MIDKGLGPKGEELAQRYLRELGYRIVASNWRSRRREVDIIAQDGDLLVFVEVKSRSNISYGAPANFVNKKKRQHLTQIAMDYMEKINYEGEIRFDVIGVVQNSRGRMSIKHYRDAFFPGL